MNDFDIAREEILSRWKRGQRVANERDGGILERGVYSVPDDRSGDPDWDDRANII